MAYTTDNLAAIEKAIAEGTLEVSYGDKRVKYRSLSEMLQIRDLIRNELGLTASRVRKFAQFNSGLYPDTE
jgi:hypothetical protein